MPEVLLLDPAQVVQNELPHLLALSEAEASTAPPGRTWTRKQELGHLIDSATNNHGRFVRAALDGEYSGPGYDQEGWVELNGYRELPWSQLVSFWQAYNILLSSVIRRIPEKLLMARCRIGSYPEATLEFVINDYVLHMQHHIDQLLSREKVTPYPGAIAVKAPAAANIPSAST